MGKRSVLHILLEVIVIFGYLVLGITILTFSFQKVPFDRVFVGVLLSATGVLEFTNFFTWKYATKMRSLQTFISAIISIALGFVIILVKMKMDVLCILLGSFSIVFSLVKIATGTINLVYQPLMNSVKIILSITQIVFSIVLIFQKEKSLDSFLVFLGIAFVIEAFTLFIEFVIHRYQRM